jgi:hypothetical protein
MDPAHSLRSLPPEGAAAPVGRPGGLLAMSSMQKLYLLVPLAPLVGAHRRRAARPRGRPLGRARAVTILGVLVATVASALITFKST